MIDQNIIQYVQECLQRGYDVSYIQSSLINNGHNPQNVSDTINFVLNQDPREVSEQSKAIAGLSNLNKKIPINKKQLIFVLIGLGMMAIIVILALLFVNTNKISNNKLSQGATFDLKQTQEKKFVVDGEEHTLSVDSVSSKSVDLIIKSKTFEITLGIGDERKLDLDNDDYYDIKIKLNKISEGIPEIYLKKINEEVCYENWNCTDWTNCSELGVQTRVCTDLNDCGTIEEKPSASRACTYVEPCDENWTCEDWMECINGTQERICVDMNDCGTIEFRPNMTQECESLDLLDCGSVTNTMNNCFISASMNCTPSKIIYNVQDILEPFLGATIINASYLYEIRGWNETNCSIYNKVLSYSSIYSEESIKSLEDQNYTLEEIEEEQIVLNETNQFQVGAESLCLYNQEGLTAMLEHTKENNSSIAETNCSFHFNLDLSVSTCIYNNVTSISFCYALNSTN